MAKSFYLTTTLPYVNDNPHMGHALEFVQADCIVRYKRLTGRDVFFNTGTDEHGMKIYKKAQEVDIEPIEYVGKYAERFKKLLSALNVSEHNFIRTTDTAHGEAAQAFWKKCQERGDIYKKKYPTKYCVGCELAKTDSELVDEKCPVHPNLSVEVIEEENYFFRLANYEDKLKKLFEEHEDFIVPHVRKNEAVSFLERGLQDFSISRLKEKMPWGVPVPDDPDHVMYVWFDALVNYVSALGWPENTEKFETFWGTKGNPNAVQIAGKDNLRQQSIMWQAMLMSADLPPSKQILIHGFINSGGQKMSKSLGNVVDPISVIDEYGADALRYYLLREISTFEDGDFTMERFKETYNANLANGLGNLVARIMKMAEDHLGEPVECDESQIDPGILGELDFFEIKKTADLLWEHIGHIDALIQMKEPFKIVKTNKEEGMELIKTLVQKLCVIAVNIEPFLPDTSETIKRAIRENKMPEPLFKRID